jgi:hypothetical protein
MGAMREGIESLLAEMADVELRQAGMQAYHKGTPWGTPVVLDFSRWSKVATATSMRC